MVAILVVLAVSSFWLTTSTLTLPLGLPIAVWLVRKSDQRAVLTSLALVGAALGGLGVGPYLDFTGGSIRLGARASLPSLGTWWAARTAPTSWGQPADMDRVVGRTFLLSSITEGGKTTAFPLALEVIDFGRMSGGGTIRFDEAEVRVGNQCVLFDQLGARVGEVVAEARASATRDGSGYVVDEPAQAREKVGPVICTAEVAQGRYELREREGELRYYFEDTYAVLIPAGPRAVASLHQPTASSR